MSGRDELDESLRGYIDRQIKEQTRYNVPKRGYITYVYEHPSTSDPWNHEVDVRLLDPAIEDPREFEVPVATDAPGDIALPNDIGRNFSLTERPGDDGGDGGGEGATEGKQPTEKPADEKPTGEKSPNVDDRPEVLVEYEDGDPDAPFVSAFIYSDENRSPLGKVNERRFTVGDAVIEIRTTGDGEQFIQVGFDTEGESSGESTDTQTATTTTTASETVADGSGTASYGFFPGEGNRDAFQSWAKPATTVVNFTGVFDVNPGAYMQNTVAPLADKGGTPILTLEPSGKGGTVAADTAAGQHDARWSSWADAISNYSGPLIVRLAHEMNGDWYPWAGDPASYIDMWTHVHGLLDNSNVEWCWCPNAEDVNSPQAEDYYPGDSYVDIIGVDGYNHGSGSSSGWRSPSAVFDNMVGRLSTLAAKPIIIPETASSSMQAGSPNPAAKADWITSLFSWADSAGIQSVNWFNQDKEQDWAVFGGERGTDQAEVGGQTYNAYQAFASESASRSNPGEIPSGATSGTGTAISAVGGPANATVAPGVYADTETVAVLDKNGNDRLAALESGVAGLQSGGATGATGDGAGVLPNTDPTAPPEERAAQAGIQINNKKTVTSLGEISGASNTLYVVDGANGPLQHTGGIHRLGSVNNVAICGINDARLKIPAGYREYSLNTNGGSNFMWSGIDLDQTAEGAYGRLSANIDHAGFFESFQTIGSGDVPNNDPNDPKGDEGGPQLHFPARSPQGTVRVKDVSLINGGTNENEHHGSSTMGMQYPGSHKGVMNLKNVQIEECSGPGIYGSPTSGTFNADNCRFYNNGVAQFRIAEGTIKNSTVGYDFQNTGLKNADTDTHAVVGIAAEQKGDGRGGSVDVKNCSVEWLNVAKTRGAIVTYDIHSAGTYGTIENTTVTVNNAGGAPHIRIDGNCDEITGCTFEGSVSDGVCIYTDGPVQTSGNTNNTSRPMSN